MLEKYSVIDMFCGVGGLTHGFVQAGFSVAAGYDIDKSCEYAFETNNKGAKYIAKDIKDVTGEELNNYFSTKQKILVGCAPCQPFSLYTNKKKESKIEDESSPEGKWALLYSFSRLIKETEAQIISMENVPQLAKFNDGKVLKDFIKALEDLGYKVSCSIVNAQDYGVPQRRKRLILLASKLGEIELLPATHNKTNYVTVKKAIGNLPKIEDGVADKNDPMHYARKLGDLNKRRIQATREGGFWREWPEELKLACHKKEGGVSFRSVYGRMSWDDVAPTMTTYCVGLGNGRFGHPEQDRAISMREAAIFQSFPIDYAFIDPNKVLSTAAIARQIGNAVPVRLGEIIAESIKKHLEEHGEKE
ncbi:MAG: putative BsuMI modification methylase subunit YdiO [Bacteroidota bacterium]|jgi:DNA (cytosine-5)-methyltransferase 1